MYLIALCDDETADLVKTEKLLRGYEKENPGVDLVIEHFSDAEELICMIREENYLPDVIFMDIFMQDKQGNQASYGMEAAGWLRKMDYRGKLVFLTTSREYALEAFDVAADQYLVKPVPEYKLFSLMDRLLADVEEERRKYILLRIQGQLARVSVNDIIYCEAQGKTQWLYLVNNRQYLLRMSMTEIYGLLAQYPEFVRLGAAFIVNLGYVGSLNAKEIHMDDGRRIYLPRGAYKSLREQYFNYYCRDVN